MEQLLEKVTARAVSLEAESPETESPEAVSPDQEVSILLVDDAAIRELNSLYRGIDAPTDVLSFAMNEDTAEGEGFTVMEDDNILGDVVISLETASRQAEEYGHSLEREVGFLAVHGVLHLLGYDHAGDRDTARMRAREEEVLAGLDLPR